MRDSSSRTDTREKTYLDEVSKPEMVEASAENSETATGLLSKEEVIAFNKTPEAEKLSAWLRKEYSKCKDEMASIKGQWNLNLSMYKGDQHVDLIRNNVVKVPAPKAKVRLVINRIRPHVRTEIARLTSMEPTAEVVPATSETKDVEAARAAETLYVSTSERLKIQKRLRESAWWLSVTGISYLKLRWNPDAKETYPDGSVAEGDYNLSVPTPFHVLVPDLLKPEIEDQPYVINHFAMSMEQVQAIYGDFFPNDYEPNLISSNEIMDESRLNLRASANGAKPDSCLVIEAWIKPGQTRHLPKGGLITLVDETIVQVANEGIPYSHGEYPFIKFDNVPSGSYYATSAIDDLIPLQRELNRIRSAMMEARNRTANPGIMYMQGSLDVKKLSAESGQYVEIKGGGQFPQALPTPSMPQSVMEEHNQILSDMEDISGQHQVSKGNTPTGVTAATAIQMLQEQDNTYASSTTDSIEYGMQKLASQLVQLFIQYADSERQIKIVGKDKSVSVKMLMGSDLKTATDIRIERGSSLPYSKAARTAMITDWMTRGILPYEIGLDLIDMPHMDDYYDIVKIDQRQADRENLAILELDPTIIAQEREAANNAKYEAVAQMVLASQMVSPEQVTNGQSYNTQMLDEWIANDPQAANLAAEFDRALNPPNDFDNHEAHIEAHNRVRKSQEYETADPAIKDELDRHVAEHEQRMQQKMMEDMFFQQGNAMDPNQAMEMEAVNGETPEEEMAPGEDPNAADPNAGAGNQFSGVEEPQGSSPVDTSSVTV